MICAISNAKWLFERLGRITKVFLLVLYLYILTLGNNIIV